VAPVIFNGRYELHRRLGRGGMAEVYLARDQMLDRAVAVKVLFPALATDPGFVERFRREAQSAASLSHPNIVGVYDWGEANSTYFIVMEYVEGESLAELIEADGRLHPDRAAEIASEMASALGYAHRSGGVIHRDVKPGNVLLTPDGTVKVADFGIARAISDSSDRNLTKTGAVMGTATYFSPEQARGLRVDPRSDIYALGCVLYEMIIGQPPFAGENAVAIATKHVRDQPVPPRRIDPAVPETLEAIILKCMAKDPDHRYPSARDMRSDLRRHREGKRLAPEPGAATQATAPVAGPLDDPDATELMAPTGAVAPVSMRANGHSAPNGHSNGHDPRGDYGDHDYGDDYEDDEDDKGPGSRTMVVGLGVLLLVMFGLLFLGARALGASSDDDAGGAGDISVPRVIGMPQADAQAALQQANLTVTVETAADDAVAGTVFEQTPSANESVAEGAEVTITVSSGQGAVTIPDLAGQPQDDAIDALTELGLVPSPTQVENDTVAEGMVIATNPAAGTQAAPGTAIEIQVSQGVQTTTVPDVTGQQEADARTVLEQAGFQVTVTEEPVRGRRRDGEVLSQNPPGGTEVQQGSQVTIVVGRRGDDDGFPFDDGDLPFDPNDPFDDIFGDDG
jgi:serine/threonine-protein kinase